MPKHTSKPVSGKPVAAQSAATPTPSTVARKGSVRGSGIDLSAPVAEAPSRRGATAAFAAIPAAELAEIEHFRRSRDTAAEGFKRARGTRPTGRG